MIAGDAALTQAEELIMDIGAKDIPIEASTEKVPTVEPVLKVATQEAITVPNPEAHVATSEMRQLLTQPTPALLGGTSVPPSTSESLYCDRRDWIRKYSFSADTRCGHPGRVVFPNGQAILHHDEVLH